jgi:hypothetical protein
MGFLGAVRRGLLRRRRGAPQAAAYGPDERDFAWWRRGGFAILPCFLVIADLARFSQALPNTMLWTWLGVMAIPYTSLLRVPADLSPVPA